jgi:hypothetical protein
MHENSIWVPFLGMMVLTILVWAFMYFHRLRFILANNINPQTLNAPEALGAFPSMAVSASNNLKNLFELPVVFYALVLFIIATGQGDSTYTLCGYGFFLLRVLHSLIQCTYNRVMHRFAVYVVASLVLWGMVLRAVFSLW